MEEVVELKRENARLLSRQNSIKVELDALRSVANNPSEVDVVQKKLKQEIMQKAELAEQLRILKKKMEIDAKTVEQAKAMAEELEKLKKNNNAGEELEALRAKVKELENSNQGDAAKDMESLKEEVNQVKEKHRVELAAMAKEIEDLNGELKTQWESMNVKKLDYESKIESLSITNQELQSYKSLSEDQIAQLKAEQESLKTSLLNAKVEYESTIEQLKKERDSLKENSQDNSKNTDSDEHMAIISAFKIDLENLKESLRKSASENELKIQSLMEKNTELVNINSKASEQIIALGTEITNLKELNLAQKSQLENINTSAVSVVEESSSNAHISEINSLKSEIEQLVKASKENEQFNLNELEKLQSVIKQLQEQKTDLEANAPNDQNALSSSEIEALKLELEETRSKLIMLNLRLSSETASVNGEEIKRILDEKEALVIELRDIKLSIAQAESEQNRAELNRARDNEKEGLINLVQENKQKIDNLELKLVECENKLSDANSLIATHEATIQKLELERSENDKQNADNSAKLLSFNEEFAMYKNQLSSAREQLKILQSSLENKDAQIALVNEEMNSKLKLSSDDRLKDQREIDSLRNSLKSQSTARLNLEAQIRQLKAENKNQRQSTIKAPPTAQEMKDMLVQLTCSRCSQTYREIDNSDSSCLHHPGEKLTNTFGFHYYSCCLQDASSFCPCEHARHTNSQLLPKA